jgi:hypothetical protein
VSQVARIGDEVVVGLGDAFADFTVVPRSVVTRIGQYVRGPAQTAAWQHWADRIDGIAPHIRTETIGMNLATNLSWALMAHRGPATMAWSETPLLEPPPERPAPLRTPPGWWMGKKYNTEAMGWRHEVLERGKEAAEGPSDRARIYDTTLPGYGNGGHEFGGI